MISFFSFLFFVLFWEGETYQAGGIQRQRQPPPAAVAVPVAGPAVVPDVGASGYARAYARECEHDTRAICQPSEAGPWDQQLEPVARQADHGQDDVPGQDGRTRPHPLPTLAPRLLQ